MTDTSDNDDNMLIVETFSDHTPEDLITLLKFLNKHGKTIEVLDAFLAGYKLSHTIDQAILFAQDELDLYK
jgi:hypothetical protein